MTFSGLVFAGDLELGQPCNNIGLICKSGLSCLQTKELKTTSYGDTLPWGICVSSIDVLTQRQDIVKSTLDKTYNKDAQQVAHLPDVSLEGGMTLAIKTILKSAMLLTIIAIVVAAIYYIISRGKDEDMTKAKDIILYLIIGMAIIAAAYGIIAGVTQFNVFG
jgi:hypothetical protein